MLACFAQKKEQIGGTKESVSYINKIENYNFFTLFLAGFISILLVNIIQPLYIMKVKKYTKNPSLPVLAKKLALISISLAIWVSRLCKNRVSYNWTGQRKKGEYLSLLFSDD